MFCVAGDRAEGAEGDLDNAPTAGNNNFTSNIKKSFSLEARFSFLNLRRPRANNARNTDTCAQKAEAGQTVVLVKWVYGPQRQFDGGIVDLLWLSVDVIPWQTVELFIATCYKCTPCPNSMVKQRLWMS